MYGGLSGNDRPEPNVAVGEEARTLARSSRHKGKFPYIPHFYEILPYKDDKITNLKVKLIDRNTIMSLLDHQVSLTPFERINRICNLLKNEETEMPAPFGAIVYEFCIKIIMGKIPAEDETKHMALKCLSWLPFFHFNISDFTERNSHVQKFLSFININKPVEVRLSALKALEPIRDYIVEENAKSILPHLSDIYENLTDFENPEIIDRAAHFISYFLTSLEDEETTITTCEFFLQKKIFDLMDTMSKHESELVQIARMKLISSFAGSIEKPDNSHYIEEFPDEIFNAVSDAILYSKYHRVRKLALEAIEKIPSEKIAHVPDKILDSMETMVFRENLSVKEKRTLVSAIVVLYTLRGTEERIPYTHVETLEFIRKNIHRKLVNFLFIFPTCEAAVGDEYNQGEALEAICGIIIRGEGLKSCKEKRNPFCQYLYDNIDSSYLIKASQLQVQSNYRGRITDKAQKLLCCLDSGNIRFLGQIRDSKFRVCNNSLQG